MEPINSIDLTQKLKQAASEFLNKEIDTVSGYCKKSLKAIAQQAVIISININTGTITDINRPFFLSRIALMLQDFVRSLIGLLLITKEKLLDILINVLLNALFIATGIPINKLLMY